jgi:hyperosmotically inducible protein
MNKPTIAAVLLSSVVAAPFVFAQTPSTVAPDNSRSNKVDSSNAANAETAQTYNAADIDLTKRMRQSVIADKSLSTYAQNIKIVTVKGNVTLNSVVRSDDEKAAIEIKASNIARKDKVTNDVKVAPGSK